MGKAIRESSIKNMLGERCQVGNSFSLTKKKGCVLEWLQDFTENLVDKNVQPHQYSPSFSHDLPREPRAKVVPGSGKHSIYTHFPKD